MSENSKIQSKVENANMRAEVGIAQPEVTAEVIVSQQRRRWAKLGVGAPILMTLASRPVLAGNCLSNMMSGNLSNPNRGQCSKGWSPGGWGQPGGNVHIYTTSGAWTAIGLNYNTATMSNVPAVLNKNSVPATTLLKTLLTVPQTGQLTRHFVCAYFNAKLSAVSGSTFTYIMTVQQVLDLALGTLSIPVGSPGYPSDFNAFLDSTWT